MLGEPDIQHEKNQLCENKLTNKCALLGSLRERGHWGDQDLDGRIILRWIFRKLEWVGGTGWSWLRIGTGGGHLWVR